MYACMYVRMHVGRCVCVYIRMYVRIYACGCARVYVCMRMGASMASAKAPEQGEVGWCGLGMGDDWLWAAYTRIHICVVRLSDKQNDQD
jgi:hypothetical protein